MSVDSIFLTQDSAKRSEVAKRLLQTVAVPCGKVTQPHCADNSSATAEARIVFPGQQKSK